MTDRPPNRTTISSRTARTQEPTSSRSTCRVFGETPPRCLRETVIFPEMTIVPLQVGGQERGRAGTRQTAASGPIRARDPA